MENFKFCTFTRVYNIIGVKSKKTKMSNFSEGLSLIVADIYSTEGRKT